MLNWRVNPKWYLFSLSFAFTIGVVTLLLKGRCYGEGYTSFLKSNFVNISFRAFMALFVWAFLGEVVWVSYCIRELSKIVKPFYASQIIGLVWFLWFIPIVLHGEGILPGQPFLPLAIFMCEIAGMCSIVYRYSKSGIYVLILQYILNLSLIGLSVSPSIGGVPTFKALLIIYFLTTLAFMYL